jgi:thiamine-monophosphate kinase
MAKLQDLGEREIIRRLVLPWCNGAGDDCGFVALFGGDLVVTTDPVPEPAARLIGGDPDPYWAGWLSVVINASDLAAAGAEPLAFVSAVEAPPLTEVEDLGRFLQGVREACEAERLRYVGGNLREGPKLTAVGTAFGICQAGKGLRRSGAKPAEAIISVGEGGLFWRDALKIRAGLSLDRKDESPLFRPRSKLVAMQALAEAGVVTAAIDNSDGLLPSLLQLAEASNCTVNLNLDLLSVEGAREIVVDPARLWLGWGDWNVIASIPTGAVAQAMEITNRCGAVSLQIGSTVGGAPRVVLSRGGTSYAAPRLESERFAQDSWFSQGVDAYVERLLNIELP